MTTYNGDYFALLNKYKQENTYIVNWEILKILVKTKIKLTSSVDERYSLIKIPAERMFSKGHNSCVVRYYCTDFNPACSRISLFLDSREGIFDDSPRWELRMFNLFAAGQFEGFSICAQAKA